MSDAMLFGVLKMPYEMAMSDDFSRLQFYQRVQQLVARVEAQPEQEPVAFSCLRCVTPKKCAVHGCSPNTWPSEYSPKRPWVGLTDEEIAYAYTLEKKFAMQYVDAKLKELNT